MSKYKTFIETDRTIIRDLFLRYNNITQLLKHFNLEKDTRSRRKAREILEEMKLIKPLKERPSLCEEELVEIAGTCKSATEAALKLNLQPIGGNISRIRSLMVKHNKEFIPYTQQKYSDEVVYCKNSSFRRRHLRQRVLRDGWLPYICSKCGNEGTWNGEPLTLQVDHINGISDDHRKENLRFLCPNCHTQTPTHGGKNQRRFEEGG